MTNPKIEKINQNIAKTQATIDKHLARMKSLEKQKISAENEEIVALFRRENLNEEQFAQLLRKGKKPREGDLQ